MIIASPEDPKNAQNVDRKILFPFLVHIESLDNRHRCMRVIDAMGAIYSFITMCHLLKGFSPKFQI
jgi:hypothetical protein